MTSKLHSILQACGQRLKGEVSHYRCPVYMLGVGGSPRVEAGAFCRVAVEQEMVLVLLCRSRHWISKQAWSCSSSRGIDLQSLNSCDTDEPETREKNPGDQTQEGSTHNH